MVISIDNLTAAGLVGMLDSRPFPRLCLDIDGGPSYVVVPRRKELKETHSFCRLPCFKVSGVDIEALNRAFTYYGYRVI